MCVRWWMGPIVRGVKRKGREEKRTEYVTWRDEGQFESERNLYLLKCRIFLFSCKF